MSTKPRNECNRCGDIPAPHRLRIAAFATWKNYCKTCRDHIIETTNKAYPVQDTRVNPDGFKSWRPEK